LRWNGKREALPSLYEVLGWIGDRLDDRHGARVGRVEDIFVDHGRPAWLLVNAGRIRRREVFVSVEDVVFAEGALHVDFDREEALTLTSGEQARRLRRWSETSDENSVV
jgi:hypothetical protein